MPDSINQKVVAFAHGKLKKRVGRGECWDLADQALRHAGARSSTTTGANDDYQWGSEISVIAAMPGDVLQFRDYVVTTTTVTKSMWTNGSVSTATEEVVAKRPHHTAIVVAVAPGVLTVFEQHVKPGGPHVQQHTLPIRAGTTVTTEHKVAKTASGALMAAKIVKTVTVSISGKVWAYHPQPASTAN